MKAPQLWLLNAAQIWAICSKDLLLPQGGISSSYRLSLTRKACILTFSIQCHRIVHIASAWLRFFLMSKKVTVSSLSLIMENLLSHQMSEWVREMMARSNLAGVTISCWLLSRALTRSKAIQCVLMIRLSPVRGRLIVLRSLRRMDLSWIHSKCKSVNVDKTCLVTVIKLNLTSYVHLSQIHLSIHLQYWCFVP